MKIRTSLHFAHFKPGGFGRRKKRGNYMEYVIKGREPADALRYFEEICAIPHGSKNEKALAEYIKKFAEDRGLWVKMDDMYNLIIKKPGSKAVKTCLPSSSRAIWTWFARKIRMWYTISRRIP